MDGSFYRSRNIAYILITKPPSDATYYNRVYRGFVVVLLSSSSPVRGRGKPAAYVNPSETHLQLASKVRTLGCHGDPLLVHHPIREARLRRFCT